MIRKVYKCDLCGDETDSIVGFLITEGGNRSVICKEERNFEECLKHICNDCCDKIGEDYKD